MQQIDAQFTRTISYTRDVQRDTSKHSDGLAGCTINVPEVSSLNTRSDSII